ncbi:hypothetical protein [Kutzneria sp. NPDC052558]|uniref:hypothetical protein n=1 Tax=Kutzneria sp. NPDC052558 TaxID=3364121 RepID=UPI0037C749DD
MTTLKELARPPLAMNECPPAVRRRAARHIAARAENAEQCAELLDMLGLTAEDGLSREE